MFNLISAHELVEREVTEARKQKAKYQERIRNTSTTIQEELSRAFGPQIENLTAEVEGLKLERDEARARIQKLAVAVDVGVPRKHAASFAELLQGSTPDEYRAHAQKLLALFRKV